MEAASNAGTLERLGSTIGGAESDETGHLVLGELNFLATKGS